MQELRDRIIEFSSKPKELEQLFRQSKSQGQESAFKEQIESLFNADSDNPTLQAWFYRFEEEKQEGTNWKLAIVVSLISSFFFWLLLDFDDEKLRFMVAEFLPLLVLLTPLISAVAIIGFVNFASTERDFDSKYAMIGLVVLALATIYVIFVGSGIEATRFRQDYLGMMMAHLVLLMAFAIAYFLMNGKLGAEDCTAFLMKVFEFAVVLGLLTGAGGVFTAISVGMLDTLGIEISNELIRVFVGAGLGLLPVLAMAIVFDPDKVLREQNLRQGTGWLISTITRLILPLTVLMGTIYLFLIPLNFMVPFEERDILIIYNIMLFAVIALTVAASIAPKEYLEAPSKLWLKRGLIALEILGLLVSLYAYVAVIHRTLEYGLSPNRFMVIGWNTINILLLGLLIWNQLKDRGDWSGSRYRSFRLGALVYTGWSIFALVALPVLFG